MRNKNTGGAEGLRLTVFMPQLDPTALYRASRYVGTQYDMSIIIWQTWQHTEPGPEDGADIRPRYALYIHDEFTPGGHLIADSATVQEFFLDAVAVEPLGVPNVVDFTMNDAHVFRANLGAIVARLLVRATRSNAGVWSLFQDPANNVPYAQILEGSTYSVAPGGTLTITAPTGVQYSIAPPVVPPGFFETIVSYNPAIVGYTADNPAPTPNVTWYGSSARQIDDDIYEVTIRNPDGTAILFAITATDVNDPTPLVILNNPVIRVDAVLGALLPPILTQADLATMPFSTFQAVRDFMARTNVFGTVTLDCRGDFSVPGRRAAGNIGSAVFKNAQQITVRGDPADVTAFKLPWGGLNSGGRSIGITVSTGNVTISNVTFVALNQSTTAENLTTGAIVCLDGVAELSGLIRLEGFYDRLRVGASGSAPFRIGTGALNFKEGVRVIVDFDTGTRLDRFIVIESQARCIIRGNVTWEIESEPTFIGLIFIDGAALLTALVAPATPNPLAIAGGQRMIAPHSVFVTPLAIAESNGYGNRVAFLGYDFGADVTSGGAQSVMVVNAVGSVMGVVGP